jgi:NAD(P)-dependent dehydrogenase (short-subunit alcohol dehydrogenase family)
MSLYGSTKVGLEGWAECMSYELAPFNIQVKIVQPGAFKTKFIGGNQSVAEPPKGVPEYKAQFDALTGMLAQLEPNLPEASPVADAIFKASTDRDNANFRFPVFESQDQYGQLFTLRRAQGPEANVTAIRSMFNEGKAPETEPELTGPQTVLITGASTGFGRKTAEDLIAKGWNVVATMRNPDAGAELAKLGDNVLVTALDVQKQDTIDAAVAAAIAKFGKIDVLVNNAGFANFGFVEGTTMEELETQWDVNVYGPMRVTKAVLPHMRKERFGQIVNVSSVMGYESTMLSSTYTSSKWTLDGWSESLQYELAPFNIQVKMVQPGAFKTAIFGKLVMSQPPADVPEYAAMAQAMQEAMGPAMAKAQGPQAVSDMIYQASVERNPVKNRYPVWSEGDAYGALYELRKTQGPDAQRAAVFASMNANPENK